MEQSLFYSDIESKTLSLLKHNAQNIMNQHTMRSPRAVGDAIRDFLADNFYVCISEELKSYRSDFERRSLEDFAFEIEDNYYAVDCKTHNVSTHFNMPNLISVERLARFYENDNNFFMILLVEYDTDLINDRLVFNSCKFVPIEYMSWDCLTIGALGWGQIQIANSSRIVIDRNTSRKSWMLKLCDVMDAFYPLEIEKIQRRVSRFESVRSFWENHE